MDYKTRLEKRKDAFLEFKRLGECLFSRCHRLYQKIRKSETQKFDEAYFFHIDSNIQSDEQVFRVYYGNRISGKEQDAIKKADGSIEILSFDRIESGVFMTFVLQGQGLVDIIIHPALDEGQKAYQKEECIVIARRIRPKQLLKQRIVKRYWKIFFSYMEYTSLLGEPNLCDRFRYYWYVSHKGYVYKDGKIENRQLASNYTKLALFFLSTSVGMLSAIFVAYLLYKWGIN